SYDAKGRHFRKVNSLLYCQQSVEGAFADYKLSQVGGEQPGTAPEPEERKTKRSTATVPQDVLLDFLSRSDDELLAALDRATELGRSTLAEAVARARIRLAEVNKDEPLSSMI